MQSSRLRIAARSAGQHVHVDAENIAIHSKGITDAPLAVERKARGQRMQHRAIIALRLLTGGNQHLAQVTRFDFLAAEIDGSGIDVRTRSRPAETLTIRLSTVRPAMRSAASTASRNDLLDSIEVGDHTGLDRHANAGGRCR